jgi:hypothetical protein
MIHIFRSAAIAVMLAATAAAAAVSGAASAAAGPVAAAPHAAIRTAAAAHSSPTALTLNGISCASATNCLAVGQYLNQAGQSLNFAEAWNGHAWRIIPTPSPGTLDGLNDVACFAGGRCLAVGAYLGSARRVATLAAEWDGTRWTVLHTASPGVLGNDLAGVACARPGACMAVGNVTSPGAPYLTLAEAWNGSAWRVLPTPRPGLASDLRAVSCPQVNDCIAVGGQVAAGAPGQQDQTLAEAWNGTRWRVLPTPARAARFSTFSDVSCAGPKACVATGMVYTISGSVEMLTGVWNGKTWRETLTNGTGENRRSTLNGIDCTAAARCIAVGALPFGRVSTLAETWNGSAWRQLPPATPAPSNAYLYDVACPRPARCMAIGGYLTSSGSGQALAELWNGQRWQILRSPAT